MRLLDATGDTELASDAVPDCIARDGLVTIRHGSVGQLRALLAGWATPFEHPHDSEPGLTAITPDQDGGNSAGREGFTRASLAPHTDRSLQPDAPSLLAAVMVSPSAIGGQALLADGATVLATLRRSHRSTEIGRLYLRTAHGGTMPIMVLREGLARIRYRDDQVARPWNVDGDDRLVAALRQSISTATRSLPLRSGDGYILHNHRYLHGRTAFAGHRRLARLLATVTCTDLAWLNQGFSVATS